ncbi:DNA-formamidopyrimidine glycosylase [Candidatus Roizmanbacteria bacterium RIFOXYB2_FULL_41_10]|uniref:Formamidopyrimidine-DNA glycosylase n=1 Tax=Candidatus Roizmanbacteria bacterium RIFOXYA1_FULL_41_12 TaxID=1802082 RepID=A0A1F7KA35_9BACT|nr:MAG: DNA-formamidopyrimidine glycosylase [Candidatus Roizmanbacteria bacterium RIFOXYA1_FULL_41_12]OGK71094.1 MAG: DNA-formamidopyrimidine glycosylase [Candidatus Roizmanbacteria bacterium RIFOXYB2_FULL_41_10]OGK71159.1 MAG: DNA-formamidopyrimidine glycosylase [Candidatus Roizmanbacteria bacterium RIFOXYC1_FULL_41_16]OGK75054.1 MAG: DNA-formamidopyrimidine glycosylase [Candidatus Roizmanbacteria bacterium RIFOXYD1_FULL_41_24]
MPELPEVETIKRQLATHLPGLSLIKLEFLDAKTGRFIDQKELVHIIGKKIRALKRRAKILLLEFENGYYLAIHLKMTGQIILKGEHTKHLPNKHTRAVLYFQKGKTIYFQDLRKFGWLKITNRQKLMAEKLGPEPFGPEFTLSYLQDRLKKSNRPIKIFLLDQSQIAGIGNIYANEALFLAKIRPQTRAKEISLNKAKILYQQILAVLKKGIELGGASDSDYLNAYGSRGQYQEHFLVYRRQGQPCPNCQALIKRISLGGRGSFYCPQCQKK